MDRTSRLPAFHRTFLTFSVVCWLLVTTPDLIDAVTCGENKCGIGTRNQCTSSGDKCVCRDHFGWRLTLNRQGFTVQFCRRSCSNERCPANYKCHKSNGCVCAMGFGLSHITGECVGSCSNERCPANYKCHKSKRCVCAMGFGLSHITGECVEKCPNQKMCPVNSHCDLKRCICDKGYVRSSITGGCDDVDECDENPPVCGEHSVCENHPGNYTCQCLEGFIISTEGNFTCLPWSCSNERCPANYKCHKSKRCVYAMGFGLSHITGECVEKCPNQKMCPVNSHCDLKRCICDKGYVRSSITGGCDDVDECDENPPVCGEHSVCENHPGNYTCQCLEGFIISTEGNFTCLPFTPSELTDSKKSQTSVGVYIGASVGVIVLLALVIAAIFMRRRRNSETSDKGTLKPSDGHTAENVKSNDGYETISLENKISNLSASNRDVKAIPVEHSNPNIYKNESVRKQDGVRNNEHMLHNTHNKVENPSAVPYSVSTNKPAKLNDSDTYNTLDAFTLNTQKKHKPDKHMDMNFNSADLVNPGGAGNKLYDTLDVFTLKANNKPEKHMDKVFDSFNETIKSDKAVNSNYATAYFTLESTNVNPTDLQNAEKSFDDDQEFNFKSDEAGDSNDASAYFTLEHSDVNSTDLPNAENGFDDGHKCNLSSGTASELHNSSAYFTLEPSNSKNKSSGPYCTLGLKDDEGFAQSAYNRLTFRDRLTQEQELVDPRGSNTPSVTAVKSNSSNGYCTLQPTYQKGTEHSTYNSLAFSEKRAQVQESDNLHSVSLKETAVVKYGDTEVEGGNVYNTAYSDDINTSGGDGRAV